MASVLAVGEWKACKTPNSNPPDPDLSISPRKRTCTDAARWNDRGPIAACGFFQSDHDHSAPIVASALVYLYRLPRHSIYHNNNNIAGGRPRLLGVTVNSPCAFATMRFLWPLHKLLDIFHQIWAGLLLWTREERVRVPGREERDRGAVFKSLGRLTVTVLVLVAAFLLAQLATSAKRSTAAHVLTPREMSYSDLGGELELYLYEHPQGFHAMNLCWTLQDIDAELDGFLSSLDAALHIDQEQGDEEDGACPDGSCLTSALEPWHRLGRVSDMAKMARSHIHTKAKNDTGSFVYEVLQTYNREKDNMQLAEMVGRVLNATLLADQTLMVDIARWDFYLDAFRNHGLHLGGDYLQDRVCDEGWARRITDQLRAVRTEEKKREVPENAGLVVKGAQTDVDAGGHMQYWLIGVGVVLASMTGAYVAYVAHQERPAFVQAL